MQEPVLIAEAASPKFLRKRCERRKDVFASFCADLSSRFVRLIPVADLHPNSEMVLGSALIANFQSQTTFNIQGSSYATYIGTSQLLCTMHLKKLEFFLS